MPTTCKEYSQCSFSHSFLFCGGSLGRHTDLGGVKIPHGQQQHLINAPFIFRSWSALTAPHAHCVLKAKTFSMFQPAAQPLMATGCSPLKPLPSVTTCRRKCEMLRTSPRLKDCSQLTCLILPFLKIVSNSNFSAGQMRAIWSNWGPHYVADETGGTWTLLETAFTSYFLGKVLWVTGKLFLAVSTFI